MENNIQNFFFTGNAVSGKTDYGLAETFVVLPRHLPMPTTTNCFN